MTVEKYYIRVDNENSDIIENLFEIHEASHWLLSRDTVNGKGTILYVAYLTSEQVLVIKLSCPLVGCLNFGKTLGKLVSNCG